MTKHKKGFYYYLIWVLALINVPLSFAALASLKLAYLNEQLISDYGTSCRAVFIIVLQIWYIREIFQHYAGYTIISTTEYNLFKCREQGTNNDFMMFADTEEELEQFFQRTEPDKKFYIESEKLNARSVHMQIFNGNDEDEGDCK